MLLLLLAPAPAAATSFEDWTSVVLPGAPYTHEVWDVVVAHDLFGTDRDDIYVGNHQPIPPLLLEGTDAGWVDVSDRVAWMEGGLFQTQPPQPHLVEAPPSRDPYNDRHGASVADVDGDGNLDLTVVAGGGGGELWGLSQLYWNTGARAWPNVAHDGAADRFLISGEGWIYPYTAFENPPGSGRYGLWLDLDGDDDLDVLVGHKLRPERWTANTLIGFLNRGSTTPPFLEPRVWSAVSTPYGVNSGSALAIDLIDHCVPTQALVLPRLASHDPSEECENPGDCELRVCSMTGGGLLCASGGPESSGLGAAAVGDLDRDLIADLVVAPIADAVYVLSGADLAIAGTTLSVGEPMFVLPTVGATALVLQDLDNDGNLDLYVGSSEAAPRSGIYTFPGAEWQEVHPWTGPGELERGTWGDLDEDGLVDLILAANDPGGNLRFLRNSTAVGDRCWLDVHLDHTGTRPVANVDGIGATLLVEATAADGSPQRWAGMIQSGGSWRASQPLYAHFGLGELQGGCAAARVRVTVDWPIVDGACATTVHDLTGVNRRVVLAD